MRFLGLALLAVVLLAHAEPLSAATVSIVQPARPTPEVALTLSRLRGELSSIGLAVKVADGLPASQPSDSDAVIAVVGDGTPLVVEVWLAKASPGQPEIIRVAAAAGTRNAPEMLALRTIEVLRANLFDVDWAVRGPIGHIAPPLAPHSPPLEREPSLLSSPRLGLEAGAAVLTSLDGVGPAILPTVRAQWVIKPRLALQATLAGFGTQPTVTTSLGHARVSQHYALVGGCYSFPAPHRMWPFLSLSLGALRTSVLGHALTPPGGDRATQWSLLLDGGSGIGLRLWGPTYLTLGAHAQVAAPYVAVRFLDTVAATSGRPNVLLVFTMGAWL